MKRLLLRITHDYQIRNIFVACLGRGLGGVLALGFGIACANVLGAEAFGVFELSIIVMEMALHFAGQGLDLVLVRFYVHHAIDEPQTARLTLKACAYLRLGLSVGVLVLGFAGTAIYSRWAPDNDSVWARGLGFVGCGAASMWHFSLAILQAREAYLPHALLLIGMNLAKLAMLALVVWFRRAGVNEFLTVNILAFGFGSALASIFVPRDFVRCHGDMRRSVGAIWAYGRWVVLSGLTSILYHRIDVIILSVFRSASDVGVYRAAGRLVNGLDLITVALMTVFLPLASKVRTYRDALGYLRRCSAINAVMLAGLTVVFLLAHRLIPLVYNDEYLPTIHLFRIIYPGFMLHLLVFPGAMLVYACNRPKPLFGTDVIALATCVLAGLWAVPRWGAEGAAYANLVMRVVNSACIVTLVCWQLRQIRRTGRVTDETDWV